MPENMIFVVWLLVGSFIVLGFILNFLDLPIRKSRHKKIQEIAGSIGWNFLPEHEPPDREYLPKGEVINTIKGNLDDIPAIIFDTPVKTYLEPLENNPTRASFVTTRAGTKLFIFFSSPQMASFSLRPAEWGDKFFTKAISSDNFRITGESLDMLTSIFTQDVVSHYEQVPHLFIEAKKTGIFVYFHADKYLPATKEQYLNLIEEGKYLIKLLNKNGLLSN